LEALFFLVRKQAWLKLICRNPPSKYGKSADQVMVTYEKICSKPQAAMSLIGMSLLEFDTLYSEFEAAYGARVNSLEYTRRDKVKRQRAVGGGRKYRHSLRDRLLMALFWLKAFTTYEVLGSLYRQDKTTVADSLHDVLETLAGMETFHLERPQPDIPKLRSLQEVIQAFPEFRFLMEADPQSIE
jgi:hypothetical protein